MANIQEDDNFVIHGLKSEIPLVKLPVGKLIQNELLNVPAEAVALIDGFTQKQILYRELLQKSVDLAEALRRHGYEGQHNVFSISSENCLEFFIPVFASYFNGTIMAPLNHLYTEYELEYVLKISYPKVIFCSEDTLDNFIILKKKLGFIERIILLSRSDETPASNEYETIDEFSKNTLQGVNVDPRTFSPTLGDVNKMVALIMCSSGTTGLPKGVAISHLALCLRLTHSRDPRYQNTNSKFLLGIMPFFHGYGMHVTFSSLLNGHTVICMRQFDGEVYLRSIQDYKIDSIGIAPPLALFFINSPLVDQYDLSSLKDVFCGAAPLGRDVEEQLKKKLNIKSMRQGYGLTEMTLAVTVVTYGDSRPGSSGKVISFLSGKVRDPETGRSLGPNQVGELCWKGPYQMLYYYNNPEEEMPEDNTHVFHGGESPIPLIRETIGPQLKQIFQSLPKDAIAMIDAFTHEKLLYSELFQKTVNLATALRHYGYDGQNNVLSISSENCLDFYVPVLASFCNGSIMAPFNHLYTPYELEQVMRISNPKIIFCCEDVVEKFVHLKEKLGFIERIIVLGISTLSSKIQELKSNVETLDGFIHSALLGKNVDVNKFEPVREDASQMAALILCSSGTTGLPKGVTLSHLPLCVRLVHNRDPRYFITDSKTVLGLMPFHHGFGMFVGFSALASGQTIISLRRFDEDLFLKSIQDYKIQTLYVAPPLAIFLAGTKKLDQYDLSSVTDFVCGAAPLCEEIEKEVKRRFKCDSVRQGYGLTEMTQAIAIVPRGESRHGSSGKLMSFISGKVRDPETGRSLGPNQVGEFCWKGPYAMMGYYKNEQATKDSFTSDGWLKSGDLGYYDNDEYIYIIDRIKELIKYKGYQVAPAELEAIIINHPKVKDVGVVGVPDDLVGERPLAFVVKKENIDVSEEEIKQHVASFVSPQKRLSGGVIFVNDIPKNVSGKILRRKLRDLLKNYTMQTLESKL
ncbi:luciferin 4-monooxygenase-like [Anthonomus grandis grandis]|uniref:luciferin 4-monooxygenase-like n=1 Tax=Anthonomus grandis grandis TaxID=2921223 RepID=UPI0021669BD6|nr:luciferin 4-monooxygenase-like [Anthonomus grandis grandis]